MRIIAFAAKCDGAVAVVFALALPVVLIAAGLAIDTARANSEQEKIQQIADSVALQAARDNLYRFQEDASFARDQDVNQSDVADSAKSNFIKMAEARGVDVSKLKTTVSVVSLPGGGSRATVEFNHSVGNYFGGLLGKNFSQVVGRAFAEVAESTLELHIALDVSDSMGLGADEADQQALYAHTSCQFACHDREAMAESTLETARRLGIPLRLDVLKSATGALLDDAQANYGGSIRAAAYAFHHTARVLEGPTSDFDRIKAAIAPLEIGENLPRLNEPNQPGDTVPSHIMELLAHELGSQGNGSAASPKKLIVLVTDGTRSSRSPYLVTNTWDPDVCRELKTAGIEVAVVYTVYDYVNKDTDVSYLSAVAPIADQIESNLRACASPGLFASGDSPDEIHDAFQRVWANYKSSALRITN